MEKEPVRVDSIEQEGEIISFLRCECGGICQKKKQSLMTAETEEGNLYLDWILLECYKCGKETEILFDVTGIIQKKEEAFSKIPTGEEEEIEGGEKKEKENITVTKSDDSESFEKLNRLFNVIGSVSQTNDDKEQKHPEISRIIPDEEAILNAPFCYPYRYLMEICSAIEEEKITIEDALCHIDEGKNYIREQIKEFETNERIKLLNDKLAKGNRAISHGLSLILTGYEDFENILTNEINYNNSSVFLESMEYQDAEEERWEETAREGNDFVNKGKNIILNI